MFFGDPYKFAIQCDIISEWNDDYFWVNGIFNIYIDGKSILNELHTSELKFTLANITDEIIDSMITVNDSYELSNITIQDSRLLAISSPEMEDNNISVHVSFSERNDYIILSEKGGVFEFKYERGYIMNVLYSLLKWKKESKLF